MKTSTELRGQTWHGISSSNISQIAYDGETKTLYVQFHHGGTYAYDDVSGTTFRYFLNAPSAGRYFQQQIRENYTTRKLK